MPRRPAGSSPRSAASRFRSSNGVRSFARSRLTSTISRSTRGKLVDASDAPVTSTPAFPPLRRIKSTLPAALCSSPGDTSTITVRPSSPPGSRSAAPAGTSIATQVAQGGCARASPANMTGSSIHARSGRSCTGFLIEMVHPLKRRRLTAAVSRGVAYNR